MKNQFTVFDVETANRSSASICSIGIVVVKDNVIIDEFYSLVNPETYFDYGNIDIHGITPADVVDAPTFGELWPKIQGYFEDCLVLAHYATFDIGCLRASLNRYHLIHPNFLYSCTCVLGRKVLPECYNHKLNTIAHYYGFSFHHHNAMEDARVTANIAIRYLEGIGRDDMDELHAKTGVKYRSFLTSKPITSFAKVPIPKPVYTKANESHLLFRKHICITGTLKEERALVYQRLALVGAHIDEKVTILTDFLVTGKAKRPSSKWKAAKQLQNESQLQIIDEELFYTLLTHVPTNQVDGDEADDCQADCNISAEEQPHTQPMNQTQPISISSIFTPLTAKTISSFSAPSANYLLDLRKLVGTRPLLAPGATIAVFNDQQEILLQLRSDTNTWGLPGGSLELGERMEDCAKRELQEETGLLCTDFTLLNVFSGPEYYFKYPNGDEVHSVCTLYLANRVIGTLRVDEESLAFDYFSLDDLPDMESRAIHILGWLTSNIDCVLHNHDEQQNIQ